MTQHEKCSNNNSKKPPIHTHTDTNKTKHKTNRQLYITDDLFNICNKNNTLFLKTVKKKENIIIVKLRKHLNYCYNQLYRFDGMKCLLVQWLANGK